MANTLFDSICLFNRPSNICQASRNGPWFRSFFHLKKWISFTLCGPFYLLPSRKTKNDGSFACDLDEYVSLTSFLAFAFGYLSVTNTAPKSLAFQAIIRCEPIDIVLLTLLIATCWRQPMENAPFFIFTSKFMPCKIELIWFEIHRILTGWRYFWESKIPKCKLSDSRPCHNSIYPTETGLFHEGVWTGQPDRATVSSK